MLATECYLPSLAVSRSCPALRKVAIRFIFSAGLGVCIVCANAGRGQADDEITAANSDDWLVAVSRSFESIAVKYADAPDVIGPGTASWSIAELAVANVSQDAETDWTNEDVRASIRYIRDDLKSKVTAYQAWLNSWALMALQQSWRNVESDGGPILGAASWYNPLADSEPNEAETASGELYDPDGYTAAIKIDLREQFGGVRFGRNYRPAYALIEFAGKQVVVRINDVGPLESGRVIDLNERTMRFFDQSLQFGILETVKVTPLPGEYWAAGPVSDGQTIDEAVLETWDAGFAKVHHVAAAAQSVVVADYAGSLDRGVSPSRARPARSVLESANAVAYVAAGVARH
jgi:rare lipoprotein A